MSPLVTKRLFIAVELPKKVKKTLSSLQDSLKKTGADIKWVEPENIHLTLKFLGAVKTETINNITKKIDKFRDEKKIKTELFGLGGFPSLTGIRVIWAGLTDEKERILKIAHDLEGDLENFGFEREKRRFKAHITLGRMRSDCNKLSLIEKIKAINQDFEKIIFEVDNITLFESKLSPHGPTYSIIHQARFK
ncbi:MAG TPA: RNA 2',3'-cyclic phosphodiesterase [Candidatus Omnitrophota bacterium]|nr:RNA 2',3'-cyclic phosphodiesterase [Candidatus Omnitrophota bacterium]